MKNYNLLETSTTEEYKSQILKLWEENLPGTANSRYDWLNKGNPAGKTIWILAIHKETKKIIGFISLLPKDVTQKGRKLRCVILGDLVIEKKYRVFGPAISLVRKAVEYGAENCFDFIYTIPNKDAIKIAQRVGLKEKITLTTFVKPLDIRYHLQKRMPIYLASFLTPLIYSLSNLFSAENYTGFKGYFEEPKEKDKEFDAFLNEINDIKTTTGYYSINFLFWRYSMKPPNPYRIYTYNNYSGKILGFFVVKLFDSSIEIYDLYLKDKKYFNQIIKKIKSLSKKGGYHSIYCTVNFSGGWHRELKKYGFFDKNYNYNLFYRKYNEVSIEDWVFFKGNRNV